MTDKTPPVGPAVTTLPDGRAPEKTVLQGRWTRLEPIDPARHADALYEAIADAPDDLWTYMSFSPFADSSAFRAWLEPQPAVADPLAFAIIDTEQGAARGMACYMRIAPHWATCEVGSIWYAPALKRTRQATEAMYLMAGHVFEDLGYRRYEWKCDALNAASRSAALRLGFVYEGLFRQHVVYKGRNRDTTWYAMIDRDWPRIKAGFEAWLDPGNFDAAGIQKVGLAELRGD